MRKIVGLFVAVMMCLVVFSVLPGSAVGDLEKPTWSVGDKWEYTMTSTEGGMNGTMNMEITGTTTVTVSGTNYDVYVIKIGMNGTTIMAGNMTMDGTGYYQRSDITMVKTVMNTNITFTSFGTTYYMSSSNTTTYNPPLDQFHFPVSVGETWTATTTATSTEKTSSNMPYYPSGTTNSTTTQTKDCECLSTESITVPAGTFNTYKIKSQEPGSNSYEIDYISSDVGFMVKSETYNETGQLSSTLELTSYSYTGAEEEGFLGEKLAGISILYWLIIIVVIVVVIIIAVVALKRKKKAPAPPSYPGQQSGQPPMPPVFPQTPQFPQQPPVSPPQQPQQPQASPTQPPVAEPVPQPPTAQPVQPSYQPQPAQEPIVKPMIVSCYKCGQRIQVTSSVRPLEVTCPKCGAKGILK